jgi:hypothetical protein
VRGQRVLALVERACITSLAQPQGARPKNLWQTQHCRPESYERMLVTIEITDTAGEEVIVRPGSVHVRLRRHIKDLQ